MALGDVNLTEQLAGVARGQRHMWELSAGLAGFRGLKSTVTRTKLAALREKPRLRCATFLLDDLELETNVPAYDFPVAVELRNFESFEAMQASGFTPDLALFRSHQFWLIDGSYDFRALAQASQVLGDCLNLVWLWDHHHDFESSSKMALLADIVLPMHETAADYLKISN